MRKRNGFFPYLVLQIFILVLLNISISVQMKRSDSKININSLSKNYQKLLMSFEEIPKNPLYRKENEAIFSEFRNYFSNLYDYGKAFNATFKKENGFDFDRETNSKFLGSQDQKEEDYTPSIIYIIFKIFLMNLKILILIIKCRILFIN